MKRIDRFTNDFLGLSYPFLTMRNGYVCITYEPLELMEALDKVLAQTDLKPDVRKRPPIYEIVCTRMIMTFLSLEN